MTPRLTPRPARIAIALLLGTLAPLTAGAQRTDLAAVTDKVFAAWNSTHTPGCAVGIAQGGKVLLTRGYGMADIAGARPILPGTILESGSVAKQFTAAAIMLLVNDGKLRLDDDARTVLPELPVYGRTITFRHLLTHTSGLREWSNLVAWQGWPRGTRVHTQSDVFELITHQRALNYPVGDYYSYTNSGFLLLRTVVERVSGMSFVQFTTQRIFVPLGMTNTQWRDDFTRIVPGLAQAYSRRPDGLHIDMPNDNVIAAGGLLTTVSDWLLWNDHLTKKTLGAGVVDSLTRRMTLTSGLEIAYALGLTVNNYRGLREISHSGSTAGYGTYLARYPEQNDLSIAVMCNVAGAGATGLTHALVDAMVPGLPRATAPDTVRTDAATIARLAGIYRDTRTNTVTVLDTARGRLRRDGGTAFLPLRDGSYQMGGTRVRFTTDASGTPVTMRIPTSDGDTVVHAFMAAERWKPSAAELASIAGRYRNDEIDVTFTVGIAGDRVTVSPRVGVADTLAATYRDAFGGSEETVWFVRDKQGRVSAMHFGSGRAWDFVSSRVK
ncbi:serine hydrolase domain-containing protein [Gemmatimonas sp.]|jgi:CubicO group peptidase (beta-lactamase class C family)|uniref:serine hydrolase domain-containing protein n=1 Tax=Gemmatimonas sp. TaxID=1962908 RepID=UPI0037BF9E8A